MLSEIAGTEIISELSLLGLATTNHCNVLGVSIPVLWAHLVIANYWF